jgi:hypothetical protein
MDDLCSFCNAGVSATGNTPLDDLAAMVALAITVVSNGLTAPGGGRQPKMID